VSYSQSGTVGLEAAYTAHARHSAAHPATDAARRHCRGFFGTLGHQGFGRQQQAGDGSRVLPFDFPPRRMLYFSRHFSSDFIFGTGFRRSVAQVVEWQTQGT
jgi:hypothetical protein